MAGAAAPPALRRPAPAPAPGAAGGARAFEAATPASPAAPVTSDEAVSQVVFRVSGPVTVATGHSVVLPIVSRPVPVERVALFDPGASAAYPLAAVRLVNDGDAALPPGVLTLYEDGPGGHAYVGDARAGAPTGRGAPAPLFALDFKVQVSREARTREMVASGRISRGVLQLTTVDQQTTVYRLKGPARETRRVLLEHPRLPDWRLAAPPEREVELTRDRYRIPVRLDPGQEIAVEVTVERPRTSSIELLPLTASALAGYARTGALDERMRQAFEALAKLRGEVEQEERTLADHDAARQAIVAEQERIRANLASVPATSDLRQRYLDRLRQQEDQLDQLQARREATRSRLATARERLAAAVASLELSPAGGAGGAGRLPAAHPADAALSASSS